MDSVPAKVLQVFVRKNPAFQMRGSFYSNMKINFESVDINGSVGYDVEILTPDATIQDYLDGLNQFIEKGQFFRSRSSVLKCEGCSLCCAERIPLTNVDLIRFRQIPASNNHGTLNELLNSYSEVSVEGPLVDITLQRRENGVCIFNCQDTGRCKIYLDRPLVCQTYICSPATSRAIELRSIIVNSGEDELVRLWLMEGYITGNLLVHKGNTDSIREHDWQENIFTGKLNYLEVKLKDLCSDKLWKKLFLC